MANLDPLDVNGRLYRQVAALLKDLEEGTEVTMRERIAALMAIGRIQTVFMNLRRETSEPANTGTAVKRYENLFAGKNDPGRRKKSARAESKPEPERIWPEDDGDDAA